MTWRRVAEVDDPERGYDIHVSRHRYKSGSLDPLLRSVADDKVNGVFFAGTQLEWLYHPYDGGADVILGTSEHRNRLKAKHKSWLSKHPLGY